MFTAVAVLRLVQDGKLKLDDPIGKYIPAHRRPAAGRHEDSPVALAHLGRRRISMARCTWTNTSPICDRTPTTCRHFGVDPLSVPTRRKFEYSNLGYILLGPVVDHVSG